MVEIWISSISHMMLSLGKRAQSVFMSKGKGPLRTSGFLFVNRSSAPWQLLLYDKLECRSQQCDETEENDFCDEKLQYRQEQLGLVGKQNH